MNADMEHGEQVRLWIAFGAMALAGLWLLACLFRVQVLEAKTYEEAHRTQSLSTVGIPARRGAVRGRDGRVISEDIPDFGAYLHPELLREGYESAASTAGALHAMAVRAALLLGPDAYAELPSEADILEHMCSCPQLPMLVWDNCSQQTIATLAEHQREFPALVVHPRWIRHYVYPVAFSHIVGFTGQDATQAPDGVRFQLSPPSQAGRMGIEKRYNADLTGAAGYRIIRKDACGFPVEELERHEPTAGHDIRLTLDIDIQLACRDAMEGRVGAVVVMDIFTGDVLAAYSSPSFSVAELSTERWRALRSAPENPLLNRAFAGLYPPGSTIKPLILMAGIHHRLVSPGEIVYRCTGGYRIGRRIVHCYHGCSHGWLTPSQFLERSCNGCSCYVGALVGPELLCEQAAAIGFGRRTGIELDTVEGAGSFPTAADFSSGRLGPGEFANICLGQSITVTPLQSARYAAALANGGRVLKPRLVVDRDETAPVQVADMRWRDDAWQTVMAGMVDVVNSRRGTGRAANLGTGWPRLAGKTGTADITTAPGGGNITWMIAVGPADGVPRYAVSTVVEQGRSGGATVAPRIKGLMTAVFTSDGTRREYEMMAKTE